MTSTNPIHIVVALDKKYHDKASEYGLYESLKKHAHCYIKILCIDFNKEEEQYITRSLNTPIENWEWRYAPIDQIKSYVPGYPKDKKNRSNFICAESGDFLNFFTFAPEDIIVHIDADVVMQRPFNSLELNQLQGLRTGEIAASMASFPSHSLCAEATVLTNSEDDTECIRHLGIQKNKPLWCAGVVVANAITYSKMYMYYHKYQKSWYRTFNHHATGQLLMNWISYEHFNFFNLGPTFHHADWFIGSDKSEKNGQLLIFDYPVLFNHHKFNRKWDF